MNSNATRLLCQARFALAILTVLGLLTACVPESSIRPVETMSAVPAGETILVGKVTLQPPLSPGEQKLGDSYSEFENSAMLIAGDSLRPVPQLKLGDLSRRIDAPFDKHYFVRCPAKPFYILKGWVVMHAKVEVVGPGADRSPDQTAAPLRGAFRIDIRSGDKAVYIGTIQYFRDEFFSTEKVVVKDEFSTANAEFRHRFGSEAVLRKALAVPVGAPESK